MSPFLRTYADDDRVAQAPAEAAVVMVTDLARPTLGQALASVLAQRDTGRVHVLIGLDRPGDLAQVERACRDRPSHVVVQVFWPGYSTSARHGGLHWPHDGGALRCMLSHMANSRRVAYLDDDNWWAPDHLSSLRAAMAGTAWAYGLRWFVQPISRRPVCVDTWESVGPDCGVFADRLGGWVDPNCLMLDKMRCVDAVSQWIGRPDTPPMQTDRLVFAQLRRHPGTGTGRPTTFYELRETDGMHPSRVRHMGHAWTGLPPIEQGMLSLPSDVTA